MVFRKISADMKERALSLYFQGHLSKDLCGIFGFSEKSLRRWKRHIYEHGDVVPPSSHRQGRPRKLNSDQISDLMAQLLVEPDMYLEEIQSWVAIHQEVGISKSSLAELIRDVGFSYKSLHKAAAERDEDEREEFRVWARETLVPEMIVAVDESSKDDRTIYRRFGRSPSGMRALGSAQFVRGDRYSLLAAMSVDGYVSTRVVEGSVDSAEFFDFIVGDVLPTMNRFPGDRSVLLLDNCRIHKGEQLLKAFEDKGCIIKFIPPYSPDFNPIEESFSAVKSWIRREYRRLIDSENPIADLYEACGVVTAAKAREWFCHSGYR